MSQASPPLAPKKLTHKDFMSDQDVRWCPGCGDYAILSAFLKVLPTLGIPREQHAVISGIGCAARFPYYVNTYGFHTIHGRAPTIASGLKCANPDLAVWVITGDGDGLSIGGNHLLHALRRNININILLFNNRIYGLTKGQYSPTSEQGKITKSTPLGSIERPVNPLRFAIASEASFVARTVDCDIKHMQETFRRAYEHKGVSFVEILQNCVIFNDGAWRGTLDKMNRAVRTVNLEHGKPLLFGKERNFGLSVGQLAPKVVEFDPASPPEDLLVHDEQSTSPLHSYMLTGLNNPEFPVPIGVFRAVERPTYDDSVREQVATARSQAGEGDLHDLLYGASTWTVEGVGEAARSGAHPLPFSVEEQEEISGSKEPEAAAPFVREMARTPIEKIGAEDAVFAKSADKISDCIKILQEKGVTQLLVKDAEENVVGIVTERDMLFRVAPETDLKAASIDSIMTADPIFMRPSDSVSLLLNTMAVKGYRRVPVRNGNPGGPVKVVTVHHLLDYLHQIQQSQQSK